VVQPASAPEWDGNLAAPVVQPASSMIESSSDADAEMSPGKARELKRLEKELEDTTLQELKELKRLEMGQRELKRLEKELENIRALGDESSVNAEAVAGDLTHWKGYLKGPDATPYEGGFFVLDITIPSEYPYNPPKIKFETKIWHPNVSSETGCICLDVLGKEWSPALSIRTALLSIQALLSAPEPSEPQDAEVANMYTGNREEFDQTAKFWTESFAQAPTGVDERVSQIVDMGFTAEQAEQALNANGGDVSAAIGSLLG